MWTVLHFVIFSEQSSRPLLTSTSECHINSITETKFVIPHDTKYPPPLVVVAHLELLFLSVHCKHAQFICNSSGYQWLYSRILNVPDSKETSVSRVNRTKRQLTVQVALEEPEKVLLGTAYLCVYCGFSAVSQAQKIESRDNSPSRLL